MKKVIDFFRLTRREYYADFFITPPITVGLIAYICVTQTFAWYWIPELVLGWMLWTLYEYWMHRYMLHQFWFMRDLHDLHHVNQKAYVGSPPTLTLCIYAAIFVLVGVHASVLAVGWYVGYIWYSTLHTILHYNGVLSHRKPLAWAKAYHVIHHRKGDCNYGVTVTFWDHLFRSHYSDVQR